MKSIFIETPFNFDGNENYLASRLKKYRQKKLKKLIPIIFASIIPSATHSTAISKAQIFQKELNTEYKNPKTTPLRGDNFTNFKEHTFFSNQ